MSPKALDKTMHRIAPCLLLLAVALLAIGCRQDMQDQPKLEAFETSDFFRNGVSNQVPPAGTVARGLLKDDAHFWFGRTESGQLVSELPEQVSWSMELLLRGQERYDIYCAPCHDTTGAGRGMIVRRGFKQPQPLWEDRLVDMPIGYFYDVATNGFGIMPAYRIQVPEEDRWAIASYIRVLQASQGRVLEDLPAGLQQEFERGMKAQEEAKAAAAAHHDDHGAGH
ncbi:MAG: cytochrome c [Thermoanaerobaculia bacterium]|nr:cytochrome c [Thermoanaerobaculia bacterium]